MSEYDSYKKDREAFIEAKKLKDSDELGGAGKLENDYTPIVPTTFKEKWDNYWYHYKIHTIAGVFALFLIAGMIYSYATAIRYDQSFTLVTGGTYDPMVTYMKAEWKEFSLDANENGEKDIEIIPIQVAFGDNVNSPEMIQAAIAKLSGQISTGDSMLYIVDDAGYEYMQTMELYFEDLSQYADTDKLTGDNTRYSLDESKSAEKVGFGEDGFDELSLCILKFDSFGENVQKKKKVVENFNNAVSFYQTIVEYDNQIQEIIK